MATNRILRREFEIDPDAVVAASRRSLLVRAGGVLLLVALFGAVVNTWVPQTMHRVAWSFAVAILAVYAAVEVSSLRWARRSAKTMVLRLAPDALELQIGVGRHRMPYADLGIARVRLSGGKVRRVELHSAHNGRVALAGFRNMDELAESLTAAIAQARADSGTSASPPSRP